MTGRHMKSYFSTDFLELQNSHWFQHKYQLLQPGKPTISWATFKQIWLNETASPLLHFCETPPRVRYWSTQRRTTKRIKRLEHLSYEGRLSWGCSAWRGWEGDHIMVLQYLKWASKKVGERLLVRECSDRTRDNIVDNTPMFLLLSSAYTKSWIFLLLILPC